MGVKSISRMCILMAVVLCLFKETHAVTGGIAITNRCSSPYDSMVSLQFSLGSGRISFCSAIMLSETMLLTSAYCLRLGSQLPSTMVAVIGERDLEMDMEPNEQRIPIQDVKIHISYNETNQDNNIGLIRLARPAILSSCVSSVYRMREDISACEDIDDSCIMVGWGGFAQSTTPSNSRLPRAASVTVYGEFVSLLMETGRSNTVPPIGSLFAESRFRGQTACFYDWGGIVACQRNSEFVLKGLIGFHNCNLAQSAPILVTNVPYFQSWINTCLENWDFCRARSSTS